jgi:hypothetical protein
MQMPRHVTFSAIAILLFAPACNPKASESQAREALARVLRDTLGPTTNPNVAFIIDGGRRDSHLYLMFDTTAVPNVSDSLFDLRARNLASFAMRHYDKASQLDSVTVATREALQPGVWRLHHSRAFATASLKEPTVP